MSNQTEAEAIITRGCKLLMSNDPNSEEELRKLLEEIIRNKFGAKKAQVIANLANASISVPSYKRVHSISLSDDEEEKDDHLTKKLKINENTKSTSNSPNNTVYNTESSNPDDEDELVLEILEDNVCVVCKSVGSGLRNQIVECLDCHNLYHQNCATPPIEADVNDPRFVWYCHNCNKGSNKSAASSMPSTSSRSSEPTSNSWTNSSSGSSSSVTSKTSTKSSSGSSRSGQGTSHTNKQFGNKYNKLFKSVKR